MNNLENELSEALLNAMLDAVNVGKTPSLFIKTTDLSKFTDIAINTDEWEVFYFKVYKKYYELWTAHNLQINEEPENEEVVLLREKIKKFFDNSDYTKIKNLIKETYQNKPSIEVINYLDEVVIFFKFQSDNLKGEN